MDTISQENNESFSWLPVLALIVGVIAAVIGGVALKKLGDIDQTLADQNALNARIDGLEAELRKASTSAEAATQRINKVAADTNTAFKQFSDAFGGLRTEFDTIKEAAAKPAPVVTTSSGSSSGPAVAGPDEYVVKSGDTGIKIARANNVSWGELQAVNPSVNWNRLGVGQAIKLPQK